VTNRKEASAEQAGHSEDPAKSAVCLLPDDLTWIAKPAVHGLQTAVLFGNPSISGMYVERIKMPANLRLAPHAHLDEVRMVTVLSGTLYFAFGDRFDEEKLKPLPAGSFFIEPKGAPHYAMTKGEVILELHAIGPTGIRYVEPAKGLR
jgi:uncharacterized RmlC-like cupin family protein